MTESTAIQVTEEGIERSVTARSGEWKQKVLETIRHIALQQPTLMVEDLRDHLSDDFLGPSPHTLGPVMRMAAKEKIIALTDGFRLSRRVSQHRRAMRVWESLLYQNKVEQVAA